LLLDGIVRRAESSYVLSLPSEALRPGILKEEQSSNGIPLSLVYQLRSILRRHASGEEQRREAKRLVGSFSKNSHGWMRMSVFAILCSRK
jgi:hypothetical protein